MEQDFIRIAHLSDLHFSTINERSNCYLAIRTDLAIQKPNIILVTGDIADNIGGVDLRMSLGKAKEFLVSMCKAIGCDPVNNLFVVPGNHDYRLKGIWGYGSYFSDIFKEIFGEYYQSRYVPEFELIIGCFDSNSTDKKINFATGEVRTQEFAKFQEDILNWKRDLSGKFDIIPKIALLHHHPMPIWRAEIPGGILDREEFLLLRNAGTFIKEMLKSGVGLIFHGHKHFRGISKASFPISTSFYKDIGVISAGSVGRRTDNEYSYNIVDLFYNGRVLVDFRVLRGEGSYESEGQPYELVSIEEARGRRFQDATKLAPTIAQKLIHSCKIAEPSGDFESLTLIEGWVSRIEPCKRLGMNLISSGGLFSEDPITFQVIYPTNQKITWKADGPPKDGVQKGFIIFDPPLTTRPVSVEICTTVPNAFEFTKQEREALCREADFESVGRNTDHVLPVQISLQIQFPKNIKPISPRVVVKDMKHMLQQRETEYCLGNLNYSKLNNSLSLNVNYPNLKETYYIEWDLPEQSGMVPQIGTSEIAKAEEIKKRLSSLKPINSDKGSIKKCLENIYTEIMKIQYLKTDSGAEPLEICIIIYDDSLKRLKYAAYYCPKCPKPSTSNVWDLRIVSGQCAAGRAWKRKEIALELYPKQISNIESRYIRIPACPCFENDSLKAIIEIPLTYPIDSNNVFAIFELASCSHNSLLLKLGDGNQKEQQVKKVSLIHTVKTTFFENYIAPAIGLSI